MKLFKIAFTAAFVLLATIVNGQATPKISQEQFQEKQRIENGVQNGSLSAREAKRLKREQRRIQRDKKMAKADGVVTKAERRRLRKEQKAASRHIERKKHT